MNLRLVTKMTAKTHQLQECVVFHCDHRSMSLLFAKERKCWATWLCDYMVMMKLVQLEILVKMNQSRIHPQPRKLLCIKIIQTHSSHQNFEGTKHTSSQTYNLIFTSFRVWLVSVINCTNCRSWVSLITTNWSPCIASTSSSICAFRFTAFNVANFCWLA